MLSKISIIGRTVFYLLAESIAVSYLGLLISFVAQLGATLLITRNRWLDGMFIAPTFLVPMLTGLLMSYFFRKHTSNVSYLAWVVPAIVLVRAIVELNHGPNSSTGDTWDNLFGIHCESSECLYEVLVSVPLVCAVSYSVSSLLIPRGIGRN